MAPARKRGVSRAGASARQWNVGDLVLAKVKGFPPWPARISVPEKWGQSPDPKKVFVYFYGTDQMSANAVSSSNWHVFGILLWI